MVSEKKIISELSEKLVKTGLYTSKGEKVVEIANRLKLEIRKTSKKDIEKVKKILSKGEPLSKIVMQTRGA